MPDTAISKQLIAPKIEAKMTPQKTRRKKPFGDPSPIPSTSRQVVYETPMEGLFPGIVDDDNDDNDDDFVKEKAQTYGR